MVRRSNDERTKDNALARSNVADCDVSGCVVGQVRWFCREYDFDAMGYDGM